MPGQIAKFISDWKTISTFALAIVAGIFVAGSKWTQIYNEMNTRIEQLDQQAEKLKALETEVQRALQANDALDSLSKWSPVTERGGLAGQPGGTPYPPSVCPEGYYVTGISTWGSPDTTKYCIGCLVSAQVICRPLPTGK